MQPPAHPADDPRPGGASLPCHGNHPDLFFAESPAEVERAKAICRLCPVRATCLRAALERREPWGVWGGELFADGTVIARKRPRGRPRKEERVAAGTAGGRRTGDGAAA